MCLHSGFYSCTLFDFLGLTSIIGNGISISYYSLITTAAKSEIHRYPCTLIILRVASAIHTNTNTQCHR